MRAVPGMTRAAAEAHANEIHLSGSTVPFTGPKERAEAVGQVTDRDPADEGREAVRGDHVRATAIGADQRTREAFQDLVTSLGLRGNDIPDAWLAASAMSAGAALVTYDRGFRRYPGLQTLSPEA